MPKGHRGKISVLFWCVCGGGCGCVCFNDGGGSEGG